MIKVIAFDLDDTLLPEQDYVREAFRNVGEYMRARHSMSDFFERSWSAFQEGQRGRIFDSVLSHLSELERQELVPRLVEVYRTAPVALKLSPPLAQLLRHLKNSYRLALITDGPAAMQRNKINCLGLSEFLDHIIVTDEWGGRDYWKPCPISFEAVERHFGVHPQECLYIGDNVLKDFVAPKARGWKSVRIQGAGEYCRVDGGVEADTVLQSLVEITSLPLLAILNSASITSFGTSKEKRP